ncbi:hypothetical protein MBANPS3_010669 [Mucor bainieri]
MLALSLTIFLYQFVAAFGVAALTSIIISVSTLDFQLMYLQGPLDKMLHWKRFKSDRGLKAMVIVLTLISALIMFLPTLLVNYTEIMGYKGHYLTHIKQHSSQEEEYALNPSSSNPNPIMLPTTVQDFPPFDDFRVLYLSSNASEPPEYHYRHWANTESIVKTYLYKQLDVPVAENADGVWYGVMANLTNRSWTSEYGDTYQLYNMYQRQYEALVPQRVDTSTGRYYTDANVPTYTFGAVDQDPYSLHACRGQLTYLDSQQVLAVSNASAGVQCYPQFDVSLPVYVHVGDSIVKPSVLDDRYGVYRSARLTMANESSSAISVSAMRLNDTFITMAIKKQTHLTYHGLAVNDTNQELLDCSPANLDHIYLSQDNTEYNAHNHSSILCQLKQLSLQNSSLNAIQAVRRFYSTNATINSVYTYMAPTTENPFGGFGVDLTYFTALTLESPVFNLPEGEHLIAYGIKEESNSSSATSSVEALINDIDIFSTRDIADPTLPNLVKIQASLKANNFYYFSKWTAAVHFAYDMGSSPDWLYLVCTLGVVLFALAAGFGCTQRKKSLRAFISTCPTEEGIDDAMTLVAGRNNSSGPSKVKANLEKPTKFAFAESTSKSNFPIITVDGKAVSREYGWLFSSNGIVDQYY